TQLSRDHRGNCTSHKRMPAKNRVRAALLGPAVIYQDRRFALIVNSRINLRIRHQLDFDLFLPRPCLSKANRNHQSKNANCACKSAHRDLLGFARIRFIVARTVAAVYFLRLRAIALALRVLEAARYRACASRTADDLAIRTSPAVTDRRYSRTQPA